MKKVKSFCDKLLLKSKILSISYVVRFVINNKWTIAWKAWTWLEGCHTLVRCKTRLLACRCSVWAFFFFFPRIRTDSASIRANLCRTWLIRPESGRIGQIGPYRPTTKMAKTSQNQPWISLEKPKFPPQRHINVFLAFFFLCFVNQGLVMYFLRMF